MRNPHVAGYARARLPARIMSPQYRQTYKPVRNERLVTADTIVVKPQGGFIADLEQRVTRKSHKLRKIGAVRPITSIAGRKPPILWAAPSREPGICDAFVLGGRPSARSHPSISVMYCTNTVLQIELLRSRRRLAPLSADFLDRHGPSAQTQGRRARWVEPRDHGRIPAADVARRRRYHQNLKLAPARKVRPIRPAWCQDAR